CHALSRKAACHGARLSWQGQHASHKNGAGGSCQGRRRRGLPVHRTGRRDEEGRRQRSLCRGQLRAGSHLLHGSDRHGAHWLQGPPGVLLEPCLCALQAGAAPGGARGRRRLHQRGPFLLQGPLSPRPCPARPQALPRGLHLLHHRARN
ncbi:Stress-induced-phosphoprotein 1 (STI1) (Hsc70/Hsp90-organizing protein) (Hop), partial [Durusdinium trenchii]